MTKRHQIFLSITLSAIGLFAVVLGGQNIDGSFLYAKNRSANTYSIKLDSTNAFTTSGSGTKTIYTSLNNPVQFSYTSCSQLSGGHAKINENGTIVNDQQITSVESILPVFTTSTTNTELQFRASFDKETWGEWGSLKSGTSRSLSSEPYYFEFKAVNGAVNLTSLLFEYSCIENEELNPGTQGGTKEFVKVTSALDDYAGTYLIVCDSESKAFDASLDTLDVSGNVQSVTISNNKIEYSELLNGITVEIESLNTNYSIKTASGYYIGNDSGKNALASSKTTVYKNSIDFVDDNTSYIEIYGAGGKVLAFNNSSSGGNRFRYLSSIGGDMLPIQLYKLSDGTKPIEIPEYEAKLQITDSNENYIYGHKFNETFGTENFSASVLMSDGTEELIDPNKLTIDIEKSGTHYTSSDVLNSEGTYNVTISYGNLAPVKYQITVTKIAVVSVAFDKNSLCLKPAETYPLSATVLPETAHDKSLTWTSSNNSVATVSTSGTVTAVSDGTATIKATANNGVYASCEVTVASAGFVDPGMKAAYEAAIALSNSSESSSSYEFTGVVVGTRTSGSNKDVYVQSGDYALDVYNSGKTMSYKDEVTVKSTLTKYSGIPETKTIKSFTNNGQSVLPQANVINSASDLANAKINTLLNASGTIKTLSVSGSSITGSNDVTITLTTSNGDIAVFVKKNSYSGLKTTLQSFEVGDIMNIENGIRGIYNTTDQVLLVSESVVTKGTPVHVDVTGITVSPTNVDVNVNSTTTLTATIAPANASNKGIVWSSSNSNVASVDQNGVVTGHIAGQSATIYAKSAENNSISASCTVNVKAISVQSVLLDQDSATIAIGDELTLTHTISPTNATNTNVTWSSNNQSIATVSNGVVSALAEGEATITVKTDDGNHTASCVVTVVDPSDLPQTTTVTIDCTKLTSPSYSGNGITLSASKSTGASDPAVNNSELRIYANNTMTISGSNITKIEITANGCTHSNAKNSFVSVSSGSYSNWTWTGGPVDSVTFTAGGSNQIHITQIVITCGSGTPTPEPTLESIKVTTNSHRTYTVGDTFAKETVKAVYSDESEVDVTSEAIFSGYNMNTAETQTVSVSYGGKSTSYQITVNAKVVTLTSITVSENHRTFNVGDTFVKETVTAHYSDGSFKTVTATFSNTHNMSVANTYTINVSYTEGGVTKDTSYTIQVKSSSGPVSGTIVIDKNLEGLSNAYSGSDGSHDVTDDYSIVTSNICLQSSSLQFKSTPGYLYNTTASPVNTITISNNYDSLIVYSGDSEHPTTNVVTGTNGVYNLGGASYYTIKSTGTVQVASITVSLGTPTPVNPTAISISGENELTPGSSTQLSLSFSPSNCNVKDVTWSSNNTSITVDQTGKVSVSSTAQVGATATITATSNEVGTVKGTFTITVVDQPVTPKDKWTILIYMCGSDLESDPKGGGYATSDITEILGVKNQPDDVNIAIQTGGANSWKKYSISSSNNQRYHVENKQLVKDNDKVYSSYQSMGESNTLKDFIQWGLETYPAEKTGLIFWNHGGAMRGVCYDEKKNDDNLTNNEVKSAVSGALSATNTSGKLEFIGYDACLMGMQEVAEFNAPYFNYMVCSQESEAGSGWDYDTWLDDLYSYKSTTTILKAICDGFISDNGGVNGRGNTWAGDEGNYYEPANQTLSYLNLNYMDTYKEAFEAMAGQLKNKITKSNASDFRNDVIGKTYCFGYDYENKDPYLYYYGAIDVKHFLTVLKANSTFNPGDTYINNVLTAFNNLVEYATSQQEGAHDANGLSCYFVGGTKYNNKDYCTSTYSSFANWNYINSTYGGTVTYSYKY